MCEACQGADSKLQVPLATRCQPKAPRQEPRRSPAAVVGAAAALLTPHLNFALMMDADNELLGCSLDKKITLPYASFHNYFFKKKLLEGVRGTNKRSVLSLSKKGLNFFREHFSAGKQKGGSYDTCDTRTLAFLCP